jgi:hypothetical protein
MRTVGELRSLREDLHGSELASEPLEPLALCLEMEGRDALLARFQELGVSKAVQRHALVGDLATIVREGGLTGAGQLPVQFEGAAAKMMPVTRRVLVDGIVDAADADALLDELEGRDRGRGRPRGGASCAAATVPDEVVMHAPSVISQAGCAALRRAVDAERSLACDSVDQKAEHQLNIGKPRLAELVGEEDVARLWRLADDFLAQQARSRREWGAPPPPEPQPQPQPQLSETIATSEGTSASAQASEASEGGDADEDRCSGEGREAGSTGGYYVDMFVRRYTRDTRPWIPFHKDVSTVTANVALSADSDHDGGRLVVVRGGRPAIVERSEGEATVHGEDVMHAVTAMTAGVRYSLIAFFYELKAEAASAEFRT